MAYWERHAENQNGKIESLLIWKTEKHLKSATHLFSGFNTPLFFGGCFFCRCCWRSQSSKFGEHLPKKNDKLRDKPQQHVFPKLFKGSEIFPVLGWFSWRKRCFLPFSFTLHHDLMWPGDGVKSEESIRNMICLRMLGTRHDKRWVSPLDMIKVV